MKTTILSASLLLLLSSCTPTKTTNNLNAIDIAGSFEHLTELKVSQLGKNTLIPQHILLEINLKY